MRRAILPLFVVGAVSLVVVLGAIWRSPARTGSKELNVHVAASLAQVFAGIATEFETQNPDVRVMLNIGGSATLVEQIRQGAPADIVALASIADMDALVASGDVQDDRVVPLALNQLALLVQRNNPSQILSLADLARSELKVILCDTSQPCGRYAAEVLATASVDVAPASREANASAVVSRIANGDADAGIAYVTDGLSRRDDIDTIVIPEDANVKVEYPIAPLSRPAQGDESVVDDFLDMAQGSVGRQLLANAGFDLP